MIDEEARGQIRALAWRTLVAVDHVDAKAEDEGLTISREWRQWRSKVRAVIRGESLTIPEEPERYEEPARYVDGYKAHWQKVTSGTLGEALNAPVFEEPVQEEAEPPASELPPAEQMPVIVTSVPNEPVPTEPLAVLKPLTPPEPDPRDAEIEALKKRIAELEAASAPAPSPEAGESPAEVLAEAQPDEDHAALKARLLGEFASLRNMLVGHIPMTQQQLARLVALEHPKFQTWLQG